MLNVSKVVKELKSSSNILWARRDNLDYITNGYWLIKTDLKKQEYRKILGLLIVIFGEFAQENKIIHLRKGYKSSQTVEDVTKDSWLDLADNKGNEPIIDTRLTTDVKYYRESARIFKGKEFIYINVKYLEMIDIKCPDEVEIYGDTRLKPIVITKNEEVVVIYPVRMADVDALEFLKVEQPQPDEIKKVNLVSKTDMEGFVRSLDVNIQALENREINKTIESLTQLKNNIEANLEGDI